VVDSGIYEGYAGWFDGNPATMYETPASSAFPDLIKLAGGPDRVAELALERVKAGQFVESLHLSAAALAADSKHAAAIEVRLAALKALRQRSRNSNESGWLDHAIQALQK